MSCAPPPATARDRRACTAAPRRANNHPHRPGAACVWRLAPPSRRCVAVARAAAARPPRLPPAAVPVLDTSPSGAPATDRLATSPPPSVMPRGGGERSHAWTRMGRGGTDACGAKGSQAAGSRPSNVELEVARPRLHVLPRAGEPLVGVSIAGSRLVAEPASHPGDRFGPLSSSNWGEITCYFRIDVQSAARPSIPWTLV